MPVYATQDMSRYVADDQWYGNAGKSVPENAVGSGTAAGVVRASNNGRKWDNNAAHQERVRDDKRRADEMRERNLIREKLQESKVPSNMSDVFRYVLGGEVEVTEEEIDAGVAFLRAIRGDSSYSRGLD
jgi:hypothetical protein